jgi:hypothetical protein
MSDLEHQIGVDFLAAKSNITRDEVQRAAEDMAKLGLDPKEINERMTALGYDAIDVSPAAEAERQLARLRNDSEWVRKFNAHDAATEAEFNRLTLAASQGTRVEPKARVEDYRFASHPLTARASEKDADTFNAEHAAWYAALGISPQGANAIMQMHMDGAARFSQMTEFEKENYGAKQTQDLRNVLARGGDPDARIAAAQKTLKATGGRDMDLGRMASQIGAEAALELVLHAEKIAAKR